MARERARDTSPQGPQAGTAEPVRGRDEEPLGTSVWSNLQRSIGNAAVGRLVQARQRATSEGVTPVDATVQSQIEAESRGGSRLDPAIRAGAEGALDGDLSGVVVHTDANADRLARAVDARGFTQGSHVFLRSTEPTCHRWRARRRSRTS